MKVKGNGLQVGDRVRHGTIVGTVAEITKRMNGADPKVVLIRQESGHEHEAPVRELVRA